MGTWLRTANLEDLEMTARNVEVRMDRLHAVHSRPFVPVEGIESHARSRLEVHALTFAGTALPETLGGLETIEVDLTVETDYDPDTGDFRFDQKTLSVKDIADLAIVLEVGLPDARTLARMLMPGEEAERSGPRLMRDIRLRRADIRLENHGLVELILAAAGRAQGMNARLIGRLVELAVAQWRDRPATPPELARQLDALLAFIADPETLRLSLRPEREVPLATLDLLRDRPLRAMRLLGLEVAVNETGS